MAAMAKAERILNKVFGLDTFRPGQAGVIEALLDGRNVLTVMPTGAGKSLCFQIPSLMFDGLTVVVSPLVALMQDQVTGLKSAGIAADAIHSGNDPATNDEIWHRAVAGETKLLYMAPERLMSARVLSGLDDLPIRMFAVDEAHCMSQWGPAFRPEYGDLCQLRHRFPGVPIVALTATADELTRADIAEKLFGGNVEQHVLGFDRPNISLAVEKKKRDWKAQLIDFVEARRGQNGIVYCLSRRKTEEVAERLWNEGIFALPYHAGLPRAERDENQDLFMTGDGVVMVATVAFGMGIDKADVRYVFHTDLPANLEAYYQEIGRAGRDGAPADAHMIYGAPDIRLRRRFIKAESAGTARFRRESAKFETLLDYCEAASCRRHLLSSYFVGSEAANNVPCGNCDVCLGTAEQKEKRVVRVSPASLDRPDGAASPLLDVLKALRLKIARQRKTKAYKVFPDRSLIDMAERRPRTKEEFADIHGVGAVKLRKFSAPFLAAIDDVTAREAA